MSQSLPIPDDSRDGWRYRPASKLTRHNDEGGKETNDEALDRLNVTAQPGGVSDVISDPDRERARAIAAQMIDHLQPMLAALGAVAHLRCGRCDRTIPSNDCNATVELRLDAGTIVAARCHNCCGREVRFASNDWRNGLSARIVRAVELHIEGRTQAKIAKLLRVKQPAISKWLRKLSREQRVAVARERLEHLSVKQTTRNNFLIATPSATYAPL